MKQVITEAPGRINIIGEHTDYNDGFVFPASINLAIRQVIEKNSSNSRCTLLSEHFNEVFEFDLNEIVKSRLTWANYLLGIVSELNKITNKIRGFDCTFNGNIPLGGGVSSSSALQVSFILALNELFDLNLSKIEMAKICQLADHNFIGMRGGMMDQFTILHGLKNKVLLLDCRSLEYDLLPFDLGEYQLLLLNTNVSHSLAHSEYNTRRLECENGLKFIQSVLPEITSLRDVSLEQLSNMKSQIPMTLYSRCYHVISENARTLLAAKAMRNHDFKILGELMYASHESLTGDYNVSCAELDFLVNESKSKNYVLGSRMMGGGFGGCTISIVDKSKIQEYIEVSSKAYFEEFGLKLTPLEITIEDGAKVCSRK